MFVRSVALVLLGYNTLLYLAALQFSFLNIMLKGGHRYTYCNFCKYFKYSRSPWSLVSKTHPDFAFMEHFTWEYKVSVKNIFRFLTVKLVLTQYTLFLVPLLDFNMFSWQNNLFLRLQMVSTQTIQLRHQIQLFINSVVLV